MEKKYLNESTSRGEAIRERGIYEICASDRRCDPESGILAAKEMNASVVMITVVENEVENNRSVAFYPSRYLPVAGYTTQDYLNRTVRAAHENGIKVFAMINLPHELWLAEHPGSISVYSNGEESDAYRRTYFYRIVPPSVLVNSPEMLEDLQGIIGEVVSYGFDGITLNDNFEFPSWYLAKEKRTLLSSYDPVSISYFEKEMKREVLGNGAVERAAYIESTPEIYNDWIRWRAWQVTTLLAICQEFVDDSGRDIEFGPHLLVGNWVYNDNGLDYFDIAKNVDAMYLMFGDGEKNSDIPAILQKCRNATPKKIAASIYLNNTKSKNDKLLSERIRLVYDSGADQVSLFDFNQIVWNGLENAVGKAFSDIEHESGSTAFSFL
jgi:hypothetical protein